MDKKEEFKNFIKNNPEFINVVKSGVSSWQQLYEIYDIYGNDENVWSKYKIKKEIPEERKESKISKMGIKDVLASLKKIDVDSLQEGLSGIGKAASFLEELTIKTPKEKEEKKAKKKKETTIERFFDD